MKLKKIKLTNYRCFGSEAVIEMDDINAFIGDNGTGKTAALSALNCIFAAKPSERMLSKSDFHVDSNEPKDSENDRQLSIEVVFELNELSDEKLPDQAVACFFKRLTTKSKGEDDLVLRIRLEATWQKSANIDGSIDSKIYFIVCDEDGIETESDKIEARRAQLDQIRVIYVPAVRNPSSQLRNVSGTLLNQILQKVSWSEHTKSKVEGFIEELNSQLSVDGTICALNQILDNSWNNYTVDSGLSQARLLVGNSTLKKVLTDTGVSFQSPYSDDEISIDELSDGLKSLFYISLVESVLETEFQITSDKNPNLTVDPTEYQPPVFTLLVLEEPESHISPHRLGKLILNLRKLSERYNCQVIVSSHSSSIIKRIDPTEIRYFRKNKETECSEVSMITLPDEESEADQYKFIKGAVQTYPELYFSKIVILGEGESEEIILPRIWEKYNSNLDVDGISVVPLGGRHVNHLWRLLDDLHIPYVTLLDLDRERYEGGWSRIHYVIDQLAKIGISKKEFLETGPTSLTDEKFAEMPNWGYEYGDITVLEQWITKLEDYGVFFSSPLDIDFLMLEQWEDAYIDRFPFKTGPILRYEDDESGSNKQKNIIEIRKNGLENEARSVKAAYQERTDQALRTALKKHGGSGRSYSQKQQELMIWYVYHFLDRGKPATHIQVMVNFDDKTIPSKIPEVLTRLCNYAADHLKKDQNNECR